MKLLLLLLLSGTKFLFGPLAFKAAGYSNWETILFNSIGGFLGFLFFFFVGKRLFDLWKKYFQPKKSSRKFTRKNKLLIRIKTSFGAIGLALLIPIISVPVSSIIAAKYFPYDKKTYFIFLFACVFWSFVLTFFSEPLAQLITD